MGDEDLVREVEESVKPKKSGLKQKCFICESSKAEFCIKGNPKDAYCKGCATEAFGDISYLEKI